MATYRYLVSVIFFRLPLVHRTPRGSNLGGGAGGSQGSLLLGQLIMLFVEESWSRLEALKFSLIGSFGRTACSLSSWRAPCGTGMGAYRDRHTEISYTLQAFDPYNIPSVPG